MNARREEEEPSVSRGTNNTLFCSTFEMSSDFDTKESTELIQRCKDYRRLYMLRYSKRESSSLNMLRNFIFSADYFKAPSLYMIASNTISTSWIVSHSSKRFCNLLKFLQELDKMESESGDKIWNNYFISSPSLYGGDITCQLMFTATVSNVLKDLFEAIMRRDWNAVGAEIARIPIHEAAHNSHEFAYLTYMTKSFNIYFAKFYLIAQQTLLQLQLPAELTAKKYFDVLEKFLRTYLRSKTYSLDNAEFYAGHYLIYQLANFNFEMAEAASEFSFVKHNADWSRALTVYKYCLDYEKYVSKMLTEKKRRVEKSLNLKNINEFFNNDNSCDNDLEADASTQQMTLPKELSYFFLVILNSFVHGSTTIGSMIAPENESNLNRNVDDCGGLLPMFVHLAKALNELGVLEEALTQICLKNALILERAHIILVRFNLDHIAGRIFAKATFSMPAEVLACHEFIVDIIEQRSLEPSSFGPLEDVISFNLRCLFVFLDYGRNRGNERAWPLLYANLRYVESNVANYITSHWPTRRSWWARFHFAVRLHGAARKTRKKVFEILDGVTIA